MPSGVACRRQSRLMSIPWALNRITASAPSGFSIGMYIKRAPAQYFLRLRFRWLLQQVAEQVEHDRRVRRLIAVHLRPEQYASGARAERRQIDRPPLVRFGELFHLQPAGGRIGELLDDALDVAMTERRRIRRRHAKSDRIVRDQATQLPFLLLRGLFVEGSLQTLRRPEDPHQVAAQDASNLFFGVAAIQAVPGDVRIAAHIFELRRQHADAVKI